ncbi:HipA family kinase [Hymenobacter elongatus]|uniref:Aminotransferase class I and II n=1 Tax=Hymenobacter elongatus TaxID=877208 RepID=A0A4Z0PLY0_9BACT|nr:HipA family kinase [Hymenobacter elongatus]TGE17360.1 aminotransferase class I and II [Hymenobacter elongatus]
MPVRIPQLRTVDVTRYVTPLREGGSLPALVEAEDEFLYVVKFRGAGQGIKALIAELIVGELARALGLRMPELVFCRLDEAFGRSEADEEIQDLLRASTGLNLGLHYLAGAITFDALVTTIEPRLASQIVWLDCLALNVDRTARNTNLLMWHKELWLIDHGAALYVHHAGPGWAAPRPRAFAQVKDHVLLPQASELAAVDAESRALLTPEVLSGIVALVPDEWLLEAVAEQPAATAQEQRTAYVGFLQHRLAASETFVQEAEDARKALI